MAKPFNGHRSWNAWNVSLWINNDEKLYGLAQWAINRNPNKEAAAYGILETLQELGETRTPDGATYNLTNIRLAIRGM